MSGRLSTMVKLIVVGVSIGFLYVAPGTAQDPPPPPYCQEHHYCVTPGEIGAICVYTELTSNGCDSGGFCLGIDTCCNC